MTQADQQIDPATWQPPRASCASATAGSRSCSARTDARSRRSAATSSIPLRRGTRATRPCAWIHYQNGRTGRLTRPLRRRADGDFEEIDWDTAIARDRRAADGAVRDAHGGETIFYYGGGGQGNHLGGAYSTATMAAYGARYRSSALAQEKTGEFWVNARMLGELHPRRLRALRGGAVPRQEPLPVPRLPAGPRVLKEIAKDPDRSMIVVDPVRTETAELADHPPAGPTGHRPVPDHRAGRGPGAGRPGRPRVDRRAHRRVRRRRRRAARVPVAQYCAIADVEEDQVRAAAGADRRGRSRSPCTRTSACR